MHAYMLAWLRDVMKNMTVKNIVYFATDRKRAPSKQLRHINERILSLVDHAMIEIAVSSESSNRNGSFMLAPIEPHFLVAILASNIASRRIRTMSDQEVDVHRMYHQYTNYLHAQIRTRPRKNLFPHIIALEDELTCLQNVINWQLKFYNDLMQVLDPDSTREPTFKRKQQFSLEHVFLQRAIKKLMSRLRQVKEHREHTQLLHKQLRHAIEIQEETDHHAIWVFTFVTVLFLPLSFVTSFFGMNLDGIRDVEGGQYLFWVVAVPITSAVIGASLIYAYRWEQWVQAGRKRLENVVGYDVSDENVSGQTGWKRWYAQALGRAKIANDGDHELGLRRPPDRQQTGFSMIDDNFGASRL
ncbi:uncharacterized protein B0I36DRAFT_65840 [Microdochium trichocladiopsis]|uniref:Mg2+ transporter protein n=1 Tax=Microdochium trichocladiopsis TaxID=1682393 RepID=A0A9P8YGB0_9PEZI|nr:uncharacterized protein B0I36DRAFT_65840 [Microdochium trichocladiopsis]KAH7037418.1 hypothetical protein B0I36DRAFT_65840 [Microdochium trichocladiopsis]